MIIKKNIKSIVFTLLFIFALFAVSGGIKAEDINIDVLDAFFDDFTGEIKVDIYITGNDVDEIVSYGVDIQPDNAPPGPPYNGRSLGQKPETPVKDGFMDSITWEAGLYPEGRYARGYARDGNDNFYYGEIAEISGIGPLGLHVTNVDIIDETSADISISMTGVYERWLNDWGLYISKNESNVRDITGVSRMFLVSEGRNQVVSFDNLEPDTTYYVVAYANYFTGEKHNTIFGDEIASFTTMSGPNVTITDIAQEEENAHNTVTFHGNVNINGSIGIIEKGFVYSGNFSKPTVWDSDIARHPDGNGGDFNVTATGLVPGSSIFARAYAKTADNEYIYSEMEMFNTLLPPPAASGNKPYMTGISANMFGPNNYGTYYDVASMLYKMLANADTEYYAIGSWFPDVDYSNPEMLNTVNFVVRKELMVGSDTGLFLTNEPITRASVAVIVCKVLGLMNEYSGPLPMPSAFADTNDHWSRGSVYMAVMKGILKGYNENGTMLFKPDNYVTRAELASIFSQMFDRSGEPVSSGYFIDVPPSHWAYQYIMNAASAGY